MNRIVEKCIEEKFDYDNTSLEFSEQRLEIVMEKGEIHEGFFHVTSTADKKIEGYVYSTTMRMECLTKQFKGTEATIQYRFDSSGMEEGGVTKGEIVIVSDKGEYYLPFVVTVAHATLESSLGPIKNLFHFANLAKASWNEAVNIFYSPQFMKVFKGNDQQYLSAYRGLANRDMNEQNVEEFLVTINKKSKLEYILNCQEIVIFNPTGDSNEELLITRNGWGYTCLRVETEGSFLYIEKETLTDDDFLGNKCSLRFYIDPRRLHQGNNLGCVRISYSNTVIEVPVTVHGKADMQAVQHSCRRKQWIHDLTARYLDFRSRQISTEEWLMETEQIVDEMVARNASDVTARLFQVQILVTRERYNEARWMLEHVRGMMGSASLPAEIECYYLYLTTLIEREESYVNRVAQEVEQIFVQNQDNWRIAWLLIYLGEEYNRDPHKKWELLETQFYHRCYSPVLYMEAIPILQKEPIFLEKLEAFEIQLLLYAVRARMLNGGLVTQILYLAGKEKHYSDALLKILKGCYYVYQDAETLQAICTLLMKGNKTDGKYFEWYALAVEMELRITRLYEYYMMSIPYSFNGMLPKPVIKYIEYCNTLEYGKKAFLYRNMLQYREQIPEVVRSYQEQMRLFVVEQLQKGHITRELSVLYRELLIPEMMTEVLADKLAELLFVHEIRVEDEKMKQVVVIHDKIRGEVRYPIIDGKALISICSNHYRILLQDEEGNRYCDSSLFMLEKLLLPGKMIKELQIAPANHFYYDVFTCEGSNNFVLLLPENIENFRHVAESDNIRESYKKEIRVKLLQYYDDHDHIRELDSYLEQIEADVLEVRERGQIIDFMVNRGMYIKAFSWIQTYGTEEVGSKTLVRLCSRILARDEFAEDPVLLAVIYEAFKAGKYDEQLLQYLIMYYNGMIRELRDIWNAAKAFYMDTYEICAKMIMQMLFGGSFVSEKMQIFQDFVKGGARAEEQLAFLTYCAYDYFVQDSLMDAHIFKEMISIEQQEYPIGRICKLAYLQYLSENTAEIDETAEYYIMQFIEEFLLEEYYYLFFQDFQDYVPRLQEYAEKTVIEYKTLSGNQVMLHYMLEYGEDSQPEYRKERMKKMPGGVFSSSFTLFFGESIQYYITEEADGREQLTESAKVTKSDIVGEERGKRYFMLNDISIGKTLHDYETVDCLMHDYREQVFITERLFTIL